MFDEILKEVGPHEIIYNYKIRALSFVINKIKADDKICAIREFMKLDHEN